MRPSLAYSLMTVLKSQLGSLFMRSSALPLQSFKGLGWPTRAPSEASLSLTHLQQGSTARHGRSATDPTTLKHPRDLSSTPSRSPDPLSAHRVYKLPFPGCFMPVSSSALSKALFQENGGSFFFPAEQLTAWPCLANATPASGTVVACRRGTMLLWRQICAREEKFPSLPPALGRCLTRAYHASQQAALRTCIITIFSYH